MSGGRLPWLVRLYPAAWRERYGAELAEILEHESGPRMAFDVIRAAAVERLFNRSGLGERRMQTYRGSVIAMAKHPSGYMPLLLSVCAIALLGIYLAVYGAGSARPGIDVHDEGPAAHVYQLLIGAQLLIIPWFSLRWGWREFKAGATLVALQVLAILASFGPLWLIEH